MASGNMACGIVKDELMVRVGPPPQAAGGSDILLFDAEVAALLGRATLTATVLTLSS